MPLSEAPHEISNVNASSPEDQSERGKIIGIVFVVAMVPEQGGSLATAMKTGVGKTDEWMEGCLSFEEYGTPFIRYMLTLSLCLIFLALWVRIDVSQSPTSHLVQHHTSL